MNYKASIYTLALLGALALAALSGGLLTTSDNVAHAEHIVAPDNNPPVFSDSDNRSVPENTPPGANIGAPVSATDDDGDTLTYSLEGTDADSFDIDPATGQLITKAALDEETEDSYSVTVKADDGTGADNSSADQPVTITVADVDEEPAAPAAPVVTTGSTSGSETTSLEINWYEPVNTGPAITDYDYRYKKTTDTTWTEVTDSTITVTTATITGTDAGLEADTAYQVAVRATSGDEGIGLWSLSATGSTNKDGNAAPAFPDSGADARTVPENTPSGQRVGAAVTATDADSTTFMYSLAGAHASLFDIEGSTGQIKTKEPLNFEAECSAADATAGHELACTYSVMVIVEDGDGGSDVQTVTITVSDVSERPSQPAAPTVRAEKDAPDTAGADESTTSLEVSWVAPGTTGPAITNYNVEHREGSSGNFTSSATAIEGASYTIISLKANTTYQVRVMANSDEQNSQWSRTGTGRTNAANNEPSFPTPTIRRMVDENTPAGRSIGRPIRATDSDSGDMLTYSLDAPSEATFDIDESTGQIKTKAPLDHEAEPRYTVTVTATDRRGASDDIQVDLTVGDLREPPLAPSRPTVTATTANPTTSLDVAWKAPDNAGRPIISEYEVEYRISGSWISLSHGDTTTTATIPSLSPYKRYHVQVRAINDEGESPWVSSSEFTSKDGNALPDFDAATATREVEENTVRGLPVGLPVAATDTDDDDSLAYSLAGVHADLFDINTSTGQINVKEALNFEAECSAADTDHEAACSYSVDVKVVDGNGGSATISVTIRVTDDDTEAPSAPPRPAVRAAEPTDDELNLDPRRCWR